jgi:LmbE family N-acetylglucosaminyl deacetylase
MIRKYRPEIVLCNAIDDRHIDHAKGSKLVSDACFYPDWEEETELDGEQQLAWRPKVVTITFNGKILNLILLLILQDLQIRK